MFNFSKSSFNFAKSNFSLSISACFVLFSASVAAIFLSDSVFSLFGSVLEDTVIFSMSDFDVANASVSVLIWSFNSVIFFWNSNFSAWATTGGAAAAADAAGATTTASVTDLFASSLFLVFSD